MFKNPKFSSTETSSFNTLYRQLSFQKFFALELHKTSKNCKNCWAVFQAAINSAAIFNPLTWLHDFTRLDFTRLDSTWLEFTRLYVTWLYTTLRDWTLHDWTLCDWTLHDFTWLEFTRLDFTRLDFTRLDFMRLYATRLDFTRLYATWLYTTLRNVDYTTLCESVINYSEVLYAKFGRLYIQYWCIDGKFYIYHQYTNNVFILQ
jgi:hypothetical protein